MSLLRRADNPGWPHTVIFPEGTTTNGKALIRVSDLPIYIMKGFCLENHLDIGHIEIFIEIFIMTSP